MRCRQWIAVIAQVRRLLRDQKLNSTNPFRIADSAPITLMTYTRGKRSQSAIGHDLVVFGDKAYNDQELEDRLWDKRRIQLFPIRCKNQQ